MSDFDRAVPKVASESVSHDPQRPTFGSTPGPDMMQAAFADMMGAYTRAWLAATPFAYQAAMSFWPNVSIDGIDEFMNDDVFRPRRRRSQQRDVLLLEGGNNRSQGREAASLVYDSGKPEKKAA